MSSQSVQLDPRKQLHAKVLDLLNKRYQMSARRMWRLHDQWRKNEEQFIAYLPEREADAKRRNEREQGGKPQYTTIVLPYTYAMLMSAHSYWTTVFMGRAPVLQVSGRHGETENQVMAVEALLDYQMQVGNMMPPLYFWLLDAGKFGIGIIGNYWENEQISISQFVDVPQTLYGMPLGGPPQRQLQTQMLPGYQGSKLWNIRPYDYYPDPRVPLHDPQRGEFVAYHSEVGLHEIMGRAETGGWINTKPELLKAFGGRGATGREQGSPQIQLPNDESFSITQDDLADTGPYGLITMYVNLVPSEWGLTEVNHREKWVFTAALKGRGVTEGQLGNLELILEARPLGCYANKFPINVLQMEPEAYALTSRGMPEIMRPLQNTMDWLVNSHMYNVRKTMNNQWLVDPSRVVMNDFVDPMAGGTIRAKAAAYGTDLRTAVAQLPVVDVTRQHLADIMFIHDFAQRAIGVNDQIMGMVNQGGRKTAQEIRSSSTFGINRQKTVSELYSAMGFGPLASQLIAYSQQYYEGDKKFKIVGDLLMEAGPQFLNVNPANIAGDYDFVPVDGTMPIDRFAQANMWRELLMGMSKVPQVMMQYDLGRIFAWVAQLGGLKNIHKFKVQIAPDQRLALAAQAGNVVPLPTNRSPEVVPEPGQVSGMGTTG